MGTRKKTLTTDCKNCSKLEITNNNLTSHLICHWGNKPKYMVEPKGKKPIFCNLIKEKS